jgi:hypothetical protein
MKRFALPLVLLASPLYADLDLAPQEAASIKSFDVQKVSEQAVALNGQIVKIKFTCRESRITPEGDEGAKGGLYQWAFTSVTDRLRNGTMSAHIPKEAVAWFTKITTDYNSKKPYLVYARVVAAGNGSHVELLGRELKTDIRGSHIVWGTAP